MQFRLWAFMGLCAVSLPLVADYFIEYSVLNTTDRKITFMWQFQEKTCRSFHAVIHPDEKKVLAVRVPENCTLVDNPTLYLIKDKKKVTLKQIQAPAQRRTGTWQGYPLYTILIKNGEYVAEKSRYFVQGRP